MPATAEEAIRLLTDAGLAITALDEQRIPLRRVEICRRLMSYCSVDADWRARLHWDTPVLGLADWSDSVHAEFVESVLEQVFHLPYSPGEEQGVETFGGVVRLVENRLRELWWRETVPTCHSQSVFYELRRATRSRWSAPVAKARIRPRTRLRDCLSAAEATELRDWLRRRFGVAELPVGHRVLGIAFLEIGATWLALWFPCFLFWLVTAGDPGRPAVSLWTGLLVPPVALAVLLNLWARSTWLGVRTLADLTRWMLRQNARTVGRIEQAGR